MAGFGEEGHGWYRGGEREVSFEGGKWEKVDGFKLETACISLARRSPHLRCGSISNLGNPIISEPGRHWHTKCSHILSVERLFSYCSPRLESIGANHPADVVVALTLHNIHNELAAYGWILGTEL